MNLTKTPYLVLFILLGAVGVGAASAVMTITLAGDVQVDGNLNVDGTLTAAEYGFSTTQTHSLRIYGTELSTDSDAIYTRSSANFRFDSTSPTSVADAQFFGIPDDANIIGFKCRLVDGSNAHSVNCKLNHITTGSVNDESRISTGVPEQPGLDIFIGTLTPFIFDADSSALSVSYATTPGCPNGQCIFDFAEITYEVSKAD